MDSEKQGQSCAMHKTTAFFSPSTDFFSPGKVFLSTEHPLTKREKLIWFIGNFPDFKMRWYS